MTHRIYQELSNLLSVHQNSIQDSTFLPLLQKYRDSPRFPFYLIVQMTHHGLSIESMFIDYILRFVPVSSFSLCKDKFQILTDEFRKSDLPNLSEDSVNLLRIIVDYYNKCPIEDFEKQKSSFTEFDQSSRNLLKWIAGKWYLSIHDFEAAKIIFKALYSKNVLNYPILFEMGINALDRHHLQEALNYGKECIQNQPSCLFGYLLYLNALKKTRFYEEALHLISQNKFQFGGNSDFIGLEADVLFLMDESVTSLRLYQKAMESNHYNLKIWKNLGLALISYQDFDEVKDIIRISYDYDSQVPVSYILSSSALVAQDDFENAIKALLEGLKSVIDPYEIYLELANSYALLHDDFNEYMYIQKVIELKPKDFRPKILLGEYFQRHDDYLGAKDIYLKILQSDATYTPAKLGLIQISFKEKVSPENIHQLINEVLQLEPNNLDVWFLKAELFFEERKFKQSESLFLEYLKTESTNISALHYLGLINVIFHQNFQKSKEFFQKALTIAPNNLQIGIDLTRLYLYYLNQPDLAMEVIQQFWDSNSDSEELKELYTEIQHQLDSL